MSTEDRVSLTVQERQRLASIEAMLESADPELSRTLRGQKRPEEQAWARSWKRRGQRFLAALERTWVGPVVIVVGMALIFGTISSLVWLTVPGALLTATGLGLCLSGFKKQRAQRGQAPGTGQGATD